MVRRRMSAPITCRCISMFPLCCLSGALPAYIWPYSFAHGHSAGRSRCGPYRSPPGSRMAACRGWRWWTRGFRSATPSRERPRFCSAFPRCAARCRLGCCGRWRFISTTAPWRREACRCGSSPPKRRRAPVPCLRCAYVNWCWRQTARRYTGVCAVFTPEPLADGGFCAIVPAEGGVCGA